MVDEPITAICLCPNCFTPADEPGRCKVCSHERVVCRLGDSDDPFRRPLVTGAGEVRTQAPLWWLLQTVGEIAKVAARKAKES